MRRENRDSSLEGHNNSFVTFGQVNRGPGITSFMLKLCVGFVSTFAYHKAWPLRVAKEMLTIGLQGLKRLQRDGQDQEDRSMVVFHQILLLHRDVDVDHFLGPTDGFECFGKDGAGNGRAIWPHYETLSYMSRYITIYSSMNFDSTRYFLFLFLVALIARISMAVLFQFDGLYGQDPYAYFNYSLELRQALGQLKPPPPFFWPIGYPLLVVLATLFAGARPLAGQLVSTIAGALIAPLIFLMVLGSKTWRQSRGNGCWIAGGYIRAIDALQHVDHV